MNAGDGPVGYFAGVHPCLHLNGRRRGGSAARCDALLKSFPRDAAASFSAQVLHSRPRRYAEFHDGDRLKSVQESPRKVGLVPREGTPRERVRKLGPAPGYSFGTKSPNEYPGRRRGFFDFFSFFLN